VKIRPGSLVKGRRNTGKGERGLEEKKKAQQGILNCAALCEVKESFVKNRDTAPFYEPCPGTRPYRDSQGRGGGRNPLCERKNRRTIMKEVHRALTIPKRTKKVRNKKANKKKNTKTNTSKERKGAIAKKPKARWAQSEAIRIIFSGAPHSFLRQPD